MARNTSGRPDGNTLPAGSSRIGFIYDGNAETPHISALLENTGTDLVLTVPWSIEYGKLYRRWFTEDDDPARLGDADTNADQTSPLPEDILFRDRLGTVALIGCSSMGYNTQMLPPAHGAGRIRVSFAVLGADSVEGFKRICGLESEISGLGEWMGLKSVTERRELSGNYRYRIEAEAPEPKKLGRRLNLMARPVFRIIRSVPDETTIREATRIRTEIDRPRDWEDHFRVHRSVRDLVSVSSWRAASFQSHTALPTRANFHVPERPPMKRMLDVVTHATGIETQPSLEKLNFLFRFGDLGTSGVDRWLRLQDKFSRGIDPILASLNYPAGAAETSMVEMCIGLEALGYQLALENGCSTSAANGLKFHQRVTLIGSSISYELPFDPAELGTRSADAYNGLKHANRERPDVLKTVNTWRELVLLFRFWVAARLGVPATVIRENFERDPLRYEYVLA